MKTRHELRKDCMNILYQIDIYENTFNQIAFEEQDLINKIHEKGGWNELNENNFRCKFYGFDKNVKEKIKVRSDIEKNDLDGLEINESRDSCSRDSFT